MLIKSFEILNKKAALVRKWCLFSTTEAGFGHSISCLSAADITTLLFNDYFSYDLLTPLNKYHDRLVFSKGHAVPLLYTLFGEDGPSQMALEDNAMFGTEPDTIILQSSDAVSTAKLVPSMVNHKGMVYLRTLRPKTPLTYKVEDEIKISDSKFLKHSIKDQLTSVATGITVFEALKAAENLKEEGIKIRVVDCYAINPIDKETLKKCLK